MNRSALGRTLAMVGVLAIILLPLSSAFPHLNDLTASSTGPVPDHWAASAFPIVWNINPARGGNVQGSRAVADVIQASFTTWTSAPNTTLSVARGNDSTKTAAGMDNTNLICFVCTGDFSSEAETLAVTMTTVATSVGDSDGRGGTTQFVGQILDADILFNPSNTFTTDTGNGTVQDVQTVATHEIGHFFGLDHSPIVRAIMFPFTPDVETTLGYDDVAGISAMYPASGQAVGTGSISGTVRLNGAGVFGAHVFADSQTGAEAFAAFNIRKTPIGTLSTPGGSYTITGVPPDSYVVTAEPLDLPVTNTDVSDFPKAYNQGAVQTNFTTRSH
ncbi:MAG: Peptidase [Acidobacteriales bacterium]|nr:Peptidase [Terriglobales bacterium]